MVHVCSDVSGKHTAIFSVTIWFREMLKWFGRKGVSHLCRKVGKKSDKSDLRTLRENPTNRTYAHSEKIRQIGLTHFPRKSDKLDLRTFRENPTNWTYALSDKIRQTGLTHIPRKSGKSDFRTLQENPANRTSALSEKIRHIGLTHIPHW